MLVFRLAIAVLVLGTSALGGDAGSLPPTITCVKQLGPVKVRKPIPKSTSNVTKNVVIIKNIIRKVNITIIPIAQTVTETATNQETTTKTAGAGTKTATDTVTSPVTVTSTTELTEVETKTETITTTKTIPAVVAAPAGFTPIRKAPGYVAKLKARELKERVERDSEDDSEDEDGVLLPADGPKPGKSIRQYVQRVDCVKTFTGASIETFKTIIQGPKITLEPRTKTKTATVTVTVTETEFPPDVTDTVTETAIPTETEWKTIMKTNTVTETETVESQIPGPTTYDACNNDNMLITANGGNGFASNLALVSFSSVKVVGGVPNAYECCVACQAQSSCLGSQWFADFSMRRCVTYSSASCQAGTQIDFMKYWTQARVPLLYTWSNGPCGNMVNGGNL